nr:MAG TPA: hypothetical protein [Caudoviricetes sp.]
MVAPKSVTIFCVSQLKDQRHICMDQTIDAIIRTNK